MEIIIFQMGVIEYLFIYFIEMLFEMPMTTWIGQICITNWQYFIGKTSHWSIEGKL